MALPFWISQMKSPIPPKMCFLEFWSSVTHQHVFWGMCVHTHAHTSVIVSRKGRSGWGGNISLPMGSEKIPEPFYGWNLPAFPLALTCHTYPGLHHVSLPVKLLKGIIIFQLRLPSVYCPGQRRHLFLQRLYLGRNLLLLLTFLLWHQGGEEKEKQIQGWTPTARSWNSLAW